MADLNSKKNELIVFTKLDEIYSKETAASVESHYEDLRSKYNYLYKTDPTTIIRVPYTATLFGDTVTQLFSNKIVANLSSELIVLLQEVKTTIGELNELNLSDKEFNLNDFAIVGYLSALKHIKSNNNKINNE